MRREYRKPIQIRFGWRSMSKCMSALSGTAVLVSRLRGQALRARKAGVPQGQLLARKLPSRSAIRRSLQTQPSLLDGLIQLFPQLFARREDGQVLSDVDAAFIEFE